MLNTIKYIAIAVGATFLGLVGLVILLLAWPIALALLPVLVIGLPIWGYFRWKETKRKRNYVEQAIEAEERTEDQIDFSREIYNDIKSGTEYLATLLQDRMSEVWSELEVEFARLSIKVQRRSDIEKRKFLKTKIEKFIEENASTFDFISQRMTDDDLNRIRLEYMAVCERINSLEKEIADIGANIAMKGETEGGPFHRLLEQTNSKLSTEESNRDWCIEQTRDRMSAYGVELSGQQAEVLLSRVDAGDIMRMTTVFAVVAMMTEKFAVTMQASGENLGVTKKYYGIYLALLELQVYIQDIYVARLKNEYLPGVKEINRDANTLLKETKQKLKNSDEKHRRHFQQNVQSLNFSIRVTRIYEEALLSDTNKVMKARKLVSKQHDAAENTLKTVQVSAVLSELVRQNETLYHEVMTLQAPELVPFENLQIQREFETVTKRIKDTTS